MSGVGFSEFLILCLIGLIVLGPERLPKVANQIGRWVGQAKRMTRVMRRQLQEELNFDDDLNIMPSSHPPPRDDDDYSPLHKQPDETDDEAAAEKPDEEAEGPGLENDDSDEKRDV
jgi:sec-independent protein translocase protein TatB